MWSIERRHFQWPWTTHNPVFKVTLFFDAAYLINGWKYGNSYYGHAILWRWISHKRYDLQTKFQWNAIRNLHTPYSTVSFRITLSDLEWLSKIFNDMNRRAVSLRQLSFLPIWRMELLHPAMWHDHDIDFARWLHPAMWHVALESWQWIH